MFHRNIGNSQRYFDELFHNLERERQKIDELPEEKQESRGEKVISDLMTGYGLGLLLEKQEKEKQQEKTIQTKLKTGCDKMEFEITAPFGFAFGGKTKIKVGKKQFKDFVLNNIIEPWNNKKLFELVKKSTTKEIIRNLKVNGFAIKKIE